MTSKEASEISLLKKTVKALAVMNMRYKMQLPFVPDWVFNVLEKAKKKYGDDLTKIE